MNQSSIDRVISMLRSRDKELRDLGATILEKPSKLDTYTKVIMYMYCNKKGFSNIGVNLFLRQKRNDRNLNRLFILIEKYGYHPTLEIPLLYIREKYKSTKKLKSLFLDEEDLITDFIKQQRENYEK